MKAVRSILFAIVFILVFLVFKAPVFAQGDIPKATTTNYETRDLNVWSQNVIFEVMSAFSCQLAGVNFSQRDQKCLGFDQKTGELGFVDNGGGALGLLTGGIAMLYTPPANTGNYISYLSQNFGITKPTYAQNQGIGFKSISPLIGVWGVFRDISYLLFIFVFILIGIAIMLRAKIDPRTVMTIQNQIPKLIIGIIMVTLSFAIAGLLIDIMWASTYVVIRVMGNANSNISVGKASIGLYSHPISYFDLMGTNGNQNTDNEGEFGGALNLSLTGAGSLQKVINSSFGQVDPPNQETIPEEEKCTDIICDAINYIKRVPIQLPLIPFIAPLGEVINMVNNPFEAVMSGVVGYLVSWLLGGIAFFIIIILLIWNLFKLWLTLLKCYVGILVNIIFAPLWIMGGVLPGASSLGFSGWLKDLLGNLAVFPATVGVFLLAKIFIDLSNESTGGFFVPPLLGHLSGAENTLGPLIALGFVLAAPHVAEGVKKSIKEKFSLDLSGAGESLKAGQGMGLSFLGTVRGRFYKQYVNQEGKKFEKGLLADPARVARRGVALRFWGSSLGRNKVLRDARKKVAIGGYADEQERLRAGAAIQQTYDDADSRRGITHTLNAQAPIAPGTPPPQQPTSGGPQQREGGAGRGAGGGATAIQVENSRQEVARRIDGIIKEMRKKKGR